MLFYIFTTFGLFLRIHLTGGFIQCGSREHSMVGLVHHGWKVEDGQWPWHVALFHDRAYACGATLLSQWHVLTAAHCVTYKSRHHQLESLPADRIVLHFGQKNLSEMTSNVQVRHVGKVHVYPNYSQHKNDIALLVLRSAIEYSEFVLPICLDKRADSDLSKLVNTRGWIPGWGRTENGLTSDVLRTVSMPVVSYIECLQADRLLFGHVLDPNVFCAGDRNGSSPGFGDSGGGMYFSDDDHWVLRGIVSFGKIHESRVKVDTSKYTVFVNVQRYLSWIRDRMEEDNAYLSPRRTSEKECDRFENIARNQVTNDGDCSNATHPHVVSIFYSDGKVHCNGVLLNEDSVLTTCRCVRRNDIFVSSIQIDTLDRVNISSTHCHPDFRLDQLYHNLAVLKLNSSVALSRSLVPSCLASNWTDYLYAGSDLHTGIESIRRHVISNDLCNQTVTERGFIPKGFPPSLVCVNNTNHQLRSDNWGNLGPPPLQSFDRKKCTYTLIAVPSAPLDQQDSEAFGLDAYTRVAYYLGWIEGVSWNMKAQKSTTTTTTTEKPRITQSWRFKETESIPHAPRDFYPLSLPSFPSTNSKPEKDEFSIPPEIFLFFKIVFILFIVSFIVSICMSIFCLTQLRSIVTSVFKK